MSSKAMSLKAKINNYAKSNNIAAQVVLQNYMFERFLARMSKSEYCEKFVIKGGMLIAAIVGLDTRSTMDLDTTLKNLPLTEEKVVEAVKSICNIELLDDVTFEVVSIAPIRKDDRYGGFRVRLNAVYDTIVNLKIILGNPDRLAVVVKHFIWHYEKRLEENATVNGKAMFVCYDREIAWDVYKRIKTLRPEWFVPRKWVLPQLSVNNLFSIHHFCS